MSRKPASILTFTPRTGGLSDEGRSHTEVTFVLPARRTLTASLLSPDCAWTFGHSLISLPSVHWGSTAGECFGWSTGGDVVIEAFCRRHFSC